MPFFEIGGKIFETEYGPITEKEVFEAIDDMTAFYILSEGDFSDVRYQNLERIAMQAARETLEHSINTGVGVGLGISSLVPGPLGAPIRKTTGLLAAGLRTIGGSKAVDAAMRKQIKHQIRLEMKKQRAREEGRA